MTGFDVVAEARLEFDDDEMAPLSAKEEMQEMIRNGEIDPTITIEWHDEDE